MRRKEEELLGRVAAMMVLVALVAKEAAPVHAPHQGH